VNNNCTICAAPPVVKTAVNAAPSKKEKMRDIAARGGFSKSAVHRHSQRYVWRDVLAACKTSTRFDPHNQRIFVQWPDDPICIADTRSKFVPDQIPRENDAILRVNMKSHSLSIPTCLSNLRSQIATTSCFAVQL
jgi:hypothetical protein